MPEGSSEDVSPRQIYAEERHIETAEKEGPVGFCPAECVNFRCLDHRNEGAASTFFFGQQNCPVFPGHSYPARYADKSRQEIHLLKKRKPGIIRTSSFLTRIGMIECLGFCRRRHAEPEAVAAAET
jgi:hypothetical protein